MTTMKFSFNTGRGYQPAGRKYAGQHIDVEAVTDGATWTVKFWDRSRMIDGAFSMVDISKLYDEPVTEGEMRRAVMDNYDHNRYMDLCSFDYVQRQKLQLTDDFRDWIANSVRKLAEPERRDGNGQSDRASAREVVRRAQALGVDVTKI